MGRPTADDDPKKYDRARHRWRSANPGRQSRGQVQDLADMLRWAIDERVEGFYGEDAIIVVAMAAKALGVSRTTMTQVLTILVDAGKLIGRPNAPYTIVNQGRQLPEPRDLASAPISLTEKMESESLLGPQMQCSWTDQDSVHLSLWKRALQGSPDRAVKEQLADQLARGEISQVYIFRRLRHLARPDGPNVAFLFELCGILLPDAERAKLRATLGYFEPGKSARLSLSQLLSDAGVQGLKDGRTRLMLDTVPPLLREDIHVVLRHQDPAEKNEHPIDVTSLSAEGAPLLRWEYGLFATRPAGLIAFSVCYVDPKVVPIYARDLDVDQDPKRGK